MRRSAFIPPLLAVLAIAPATFAVTTLAPDPASSDTLMTSHEGHHDGMDMTGFGAPVGDVPGGPPANDDIVEGGPPAERFPVSQAKGRAVGVENPKARNRADKPGGCSNHYGTPEQCLPIRAPGNSDWDYTKVRGYFAEGVVLARGKADPLKLDKNGDGTACGAGD